MGLRAQSAPGFPCALFDKRGTTKWQTSGKSCRENAVGCLKTESANANVAPANAGAHNHRVVLLTHAAATAFA